MPDKTKEQLEKELKELERKRKSSLKYKRSQLRNLNGELIYDDDNDWSLELQLQSLQLTDEDYMNEKYWPKDVKIAVENNPELNGRVMTFEYPEGYFDRKYGVTLGDALQYRFNQNFQSDWEDYLQHPEDYDIIEVPETDEEMWKRRGLEALIKDNEEREALKEKDEAAGEIVGRIKQGEHEQWEHDHPMQAALLRGLDRGIRWESGVFDKVINQPIGYVMDKGNDLSGGLLYGILSTEPVQLLMNTITPSRYVGWVRTGYNPWDERNTGTGDPEYDNWLNSVVGLIPFTRLKKVNGSMAIREALPGFYYRQGRGLYKDAKESGVIRSNSDWGSGRWNNIPYFGKDILYWFDLKPKRTNADIERLVDRFGGTDLIVGKNTPELIWRKLDNEGNFIDREGLKEAWLDERKLKLQEIEKDYPDFPNFIEDAKNAEVRLESKIEELLPLFKGFRTTKKGKDTYYHAWRVMWAYKQTLKGNGGKFNKAKFDRLLYSESNNYRFDYNAFSEKFFGKTELEIMETAHKYEEFSKYYNGVMKELNEKYPTIVDSENPVSLNYAEHYKTMYYEQRMNEANKSFDQYMQEYINNNPMYDDNDFRFAHQYTPVLKSTGEAAVAPANQFSFYKLVKIPGLHKYNTFKENFKRNFLPEYSLEDFKRGYQPYKNDYLYINYDAIGNLKKGLIGTGATTGIGIINNATNDDDNIIEYEEPDWNHTWKPKINFNYE